MFGFLIGTACLVGLFKVAHGGCCGRGRYRGSWGHGWMLRAIFRRLDTTPGQEKVILEGVERMQGVAEKLRGEGAQLRKDVAQAFRAGTFDHEPLKVAFARHDGIVEELQRELLVSLEKIHEALDERQRKLVAEMLEAGFGFGHGHGYAHGCGPRWHRGCGTESPEAQTL